MSGAASHERDSSHSNEALAAVIHQYGPRVFAFLRVRGIGDSRAQPLTEEVFRRFARSRARVGDSADLSISLSNIARCVLREEIRRRGTAESKTWMELALEFGTEPGLPTADASADSSAGARHLSRLSPSARQALELFYAGNLSVAEIGRRLHRSEGAIRQLLVEARQALAAMLELPASAVSGRND